MTKNLDAAPGPKPIVRKARALRRWFTSLRPIRAFAHFVDVGGSVLSAGMSFQALFAVFAALWVGFGIFGIFLRDRTDLLNSLLEQINILVPGLIGPNGAVQVNDLLQTRTLDWTSVVAGAALLWVAMTWFTGTRRSVRIIFDLEVREYRNAVLLKLRDFTLAILFGLGIILSASLIVLSTDLSNTIFSALGADPDGWLMGTVGTVASYLAMFIFDVVFLMALHRFLAEIRVPWRRLLAGCSIGALGLGVIKFLGSALLGGASNNPLLASFAVIVGLLIWFNLICRVLLLTSAWIATGLDPKLGLPEDVAEEPRSSTEHDSPQERLSGHR